jgi:hypothetical protein
MIKVNHTQTIQATRRLLSPTTQLSTRRSGFNIGCNKDDKRQSLLEVVAIRLKLFLNSECLKHFTLRFTSSRFLPARFLPLAELDEVLV